MKNKRKIKMFYIDRILEEFFDLSKKVYFLKRFRLFNTLNIGSVDQRALKLLAIKVGGLKKKSA